jgi:hypothetical protein
VPYAAGAQEDEREQDPADQRDDVHVASDYTARSTDSGQSGISPRIIAQATARQVRPEYQPELDDAPRDALDDELAAT